jgi:hypothetical protein
MKTTQPIRLIPTAVSVSNTHRVAITNSRLLALTGGRVAFEWKEYAHGHAK